MVMDVSAHGNKRLRLLQTPFSAQRASLYTNAYGGWFAYHARHSVRMTYRTSAALRLLRSLKYPTTNSCGPINGSVSLCFLLIFYSVTILFENISNFLNDKMWGQWSWPQAIYINAINESLNRDMEAVEIRWSRCFSTRTHIQVTCSLTQIDAQHEDGAPI